MGDCVAAICAQLADLDEEVWFTPALVDEMCALLLRDHTQREWADFILRLRESRKP